MLAERVLSSYILRLTQRLSRIRIELQDVRTGQTTEFESFGQLSDHLQESVDHSKQPITHLESD